MKKEKKVVEVAPSYGWTGLRAKDSGDRRSRHPDEYSFKSPKGKMFTFTNLPEFVANHPKLFTPQQLKCEKGAEFPTAVYGLASLAPWTKNRKKSWQGWTWTDAKKSPGKKSSPSKRPLRKYSFRSPDGQIFKTTNMHQFVAEHRDLFRDEHLECVKGSQIPKVVYALSAIAPWKKRADTSTSWFGWTWYDENKPLPPPKEYSFRSPDGQIFKTTNVHNFVDEHRDLFEDRHLVFAKGSTTRKAESFITALTPWRKTRPKKSWMGWTWYYENAPAPTLLPPRYSKTFSFRSPSGEIFKTNDLRKFVAEHRDLFNEEQLELAKGRQITKAGRRLSTLAPWWNPKSPVKTWKGWTWYDENNPSPSPAESSK